MERESGLQSITLKASKEAYPQLYDFVATTTAMVGMDSYHAKHVRMAVEETVGNIIDYSGASEIKLATAVSSSQLMITIIDDGILFDPTSYPEPNLSLPADQREPGGLGIYFMRRMSDSLTYRREDGKNILTITFDR